MQSCTFITILYKVMLMLQEQHWNSVTEIEWPAKNKLLNTWSFSDKYLLASSSRSGSTPRHTCMKFVNCKCNLSNVYPSLSKGGNKKSPRVDGAWNKLIFKLWACQNTGFTDRPGGQLLGMQRVWNALIRWQQRMGSLFLLSGIINMVSFWIFG